MNQILDTLFSELRHIIEDLGTDGGQISPSIYDTAQVIRLMPPAAGVAPALHWLTEQQQHDGGWGDPSVTHARTVPTLAAALALQTHSSTLQQQQAIAAGLAFLRQQAPLWAELSDNIPVGVELLLPYLLHEATGLRLQIDQQPYAALIALGQRRRKLIAARHVRAGTTAVHSWEAWGLEPDPQLIDGSGGVGHSPAATAAWLRAAADHPALADTRAAAQQYLEQAAAATGVGIPGVVPTVWPIVRFEQSNTLYALLVAGLLQHPYLADVATPQIDSLGRALRRDGLGMSDFFMTDGDDTSEALAVLHASGRDVDSTLMNTFATDDHFCAYPGELQPSLSVTAHATHLLALLGQEHSRSRTFVTTRQLSDGRWLGDKWNGSWLYTTTHAMIALQHSDAPNAINTAVDALLRYQYADGGWGISAPTTEETAYAILALRALNRSQALLPAARHALARSEKWMQAQYRPFYQSPTTRWLGKEMYRPYRLARTIELAATLPRHVIEMATTL